MLKFKKAGETPPSSPASSPAPSTRRPKLVTRIDSIGGPAERVHVSLFEDIGDSESSGQSSSSEEFTTPGAKLRDVTKRKLNRLKAKQLKESAKKQQNLLSSKDFCSRQHELKIWIHETTGKDVSSLPDKKLMEYFKKFVRKWNKRKLPRKYYRGVDLHSSPLPAVSKDSKSTKGMTPKQSLDSGSLWIAPSIPLMDSLSDTESHLPSSPVGSSFGKKFATVTRAPVQSSKVCVEGLDCDVKTPPKPPVRRRPTTIITSLPGNSEPASCTPSASNSSGVRYPQPRMGSIMSSMRQRTGPPVSAASTCTDHRLEDNDLSFIPDETRGVHSVQCSSNDEVGSVSPHSDPVSSASPINIKLGEVTSDDSAEIINIKATGEGVGQNTPTVECPSKKIEAIEVPAEGESQTISPQSSEKRHTIEKQGEVIEDCQPSPNKKAKWVEEVQNTKETYV